MAWSDMPSWGASIRDLTVQAGWQCFGQRLY
jgi:hypothetical protein